VIAGDKNDVVAYKVNHRARRRRTLDERLAMLAPGLFRRGAVLMRRLLSPSARLRRALTARTMCSQYEAINRGDFELAELFSAPNVEYVWEYVRGLPMDLHDVYRGREGLRQNAQTWEEAWDDHRSEVIELIDTRGDRIAAVIRVRGRGKKSGLELDLELTEVMTLRHGLLERLVAYMDRSQALAELGISNSAPETITSPGAAP
jgi:ketosteroid isomerase-like protein